MVNVPLPAETLVWIGAFPLTNAQVNAFLALAVLGGGAIALKRRLAEIPGRFQNAAEMIIEFILGYFDRVTGSREASKRYFPLVGTMFFFILVSNWMGILPGVGSIGMWQRVDGELEILPLFRPATSDLNLTLALALVSVFASHMIAIGSIGFFAHVGKYIQLQRLAEAAWSLNPVKFLVALVEFGVGLLEIVGEFAKIASLSLRLFGNVFAGEVLMTVMASIFALLMPLPFVFLEILVGVVQAAVFSMLTLTYLTVASMPPHGEHAEGRAMHA